MTFPPRGVVDLQLGNHETQFQTESRLVCGRDRHGQSARIAYYADIIAESTARMFDSWKPGTEIDLAEAFHGSALRIVSRSLFGGEWKEDAEAVRDAVSALQEMGMRGSATQKARESPIFPELRASSPRRDVEGYAATRPGSKSMRLGGLSEIFVSGRKKGLCERGIDFKLESARFSGFQLAFAREPELESSGDQIAQVSSRAARCVPHSRR